MTKLKTNMKQKSKENGFQGQPCDKNKDRDKDKYDAKVTRRGIFQDQACDKYKNRDNVNDKDKNQYEASKEKDFSGLGLAHDCALP